MIIEARCRQRGAGGTDVACGMEGKAGSRRLLWHTSDVVWHRHCQRKLHHFREKQPFM